MPRPLCPKCGERQCSRRKRESLFQILIAPRLGLFPWHCGACRKIFLVKERGKSKNKHSSTFAEHMLTPWRARNVPHAPTPHEESFEDDSSDPASH